MSDDRHIASEAAGLAALPADHPDRRAAIEHARECDRCRDALSSGERLMSLLAEIPPPPPPSAEVLRRVSTAVLDQMSQAPAWATARPAIAPMIGSVTVAWLVIAGLEWRGAAEPAARWQSALIAACAAVAVTIGVALARRGAAITASILVSATAAALAGAGGGFEALVGMKCVAVELMAAVLPVATTLWLVRSGRVHVQPGPSVYAAAAAAGALAGHAGLHLGCPARHASPHLFAFHLGGVVLAALAGAALSRTPLARIAGR